MNAGKCCSPGCCLRVGLAGICSFFLRTTEGQGVRMILSSRDCGSECSPASLEV